MAPSFPLRGDLRDYSVNRLLQTILAEGLGGCLIVSRDDVERRLYLKDGMIVYASSTERSDRLGDIFVAQGLVTQEEIDAALREGNPLRRIGMVLLVDGRITPQELFQGVSAQVITILERMRSWRKGSYEFEVKREPKPGTVLLRIPLALYLGAPQKRPSTTASPSIEEGAGEPPELPQGDEGTGQDVVGSERLAADGASAGEEVLEPDTLFEPGLPETDEEEIEITMDDVENTLGGSRYGEIDLGAGKAPDDSSLPGKRAEEIAFHVQEVRGRLSGGPRRILGVKDAASREEIRESFEYFFRLFDPEGLPEGLPEDIAAAAADLQEKVGAAYEELKAEKKESLKNPFPAPPGRIAPPPPLRQEGPAIGAMRPRRAYFRAKRLMEEGNYWQAVDFLRQAVRQEPDDAEYRNMLGMCLVQTGRRFHEAEEHIKEAIRLDPGNPDYVASLGVAYKAGRFYKKARRMFEQALLYDKGHALAKKELRALPVETKRPDQKKNIISKLFGK